MKALSIKEPWASLIASREKSIETRTWKTNHRGRLLLCASQKPKGTFSGMAFAVVDLIDCRPMTKADEKAACCKVYPGAWSWVLGEVRLIIPFPMKGQLNIFEVTLKSIYDVMREADGNGKG